MDFFGMKGLDKGCPCYSKYWVLTQLFALFTPFPHSPAKAIHAIVKKKNHKKKQWGILQKRIPGMDPPAWRAVWLLCHLHWAHQPPNLLPSWEFWAPNCLRLPEAMRISALWVASEALAFCKRALHKWMVFTHRFFFFFNLPCLWVFFLSSLLAWLLIPSTSLCLIFRGSLTVPLSVKGPSDLGSQSINYGSAVSTPCHLLHLWAARNQWEVCENCWLWFKGSFTRRSWETSAWLLGESSGAQEVTDGLWHHDF